MIRWDLLIWSWVSVRSACRKWSRAMRFRTQRKWWKANHKSWISEDFRVQVRSAPWNLIDVLRWHVIWARWCVYNFYVMFACGLRLAFWYKKSWREARRTALYTAELRTKTKLWQVIPSWRAVAETGDMKCLLTVYRCYMSGTAVRLMKICLKSRPWTRWREADCEPQSW